MQGTPDFLQLIFYALSVLGMLFGFVASLLIKRLFEQIDTMNRTMLSHREDVLRNYPNHKDMIELKKDFMTRLDEAEHNIKNSVHNALLRSRIEELEHKKG
jgi:hypothetical protein